MKLIEKVQIKNFRSFLGTTKKDKVEVLDVVDLNIFSGSNDSGKSNVLRALNLFFNDFIDSTHQFNFQNDFNINKSTQTQKVIEIKVHFRVKKKKFSITKFYDRKGYRNFEYRFMDGEEEIIIDSRAEKNKERYKSNSDILNKENGYRRYAIRFIPSILFSYVPAIREERFFSHLYGKIIFKIKNNEDNFIEKLNGEKRKIINWKRTLKNKTEKRDFLDNIGEVTWRDNRIKEIEAKIKAISNIDHSISSLEKQINEFSDNLFGAISFLSSEFKVGNDLLGFFENFDIGTGGDKSLSLRLRGDGVQAKFIPEMLNFLDSISKDKRYFIWGFEEPENSAEYKNQQILAQRLKDEFSNNKQIFLTTHSEEFLSLYDGSEIDKESRKTNLYHVKKESNRDYDEYSTINLFDVYNQSFDFGTIKSDIELDIGTSLLRATYSKELKEKEKAFLEGKINYEKEKIKLEKEISNSKKWLVFVEDTYLQAYKISYLKLKNTDFNRNNFEQKFDEESPFIILSKNGHNELNKFLDSVIIDEWKDKRIIGLFDFDDAFNSFNGLKRSGSIQGTEATCLYRKRDHHDYFFSILLPVPKHRKTFASKDLGGKSKLEFELLFKDDILKRTKNFGEESIAGSEIKIVTFIGKKAKFWEKLFELETEAFTCIKPLFDKIEYLLK